MGSYKITSTLQLSPPGYSIGTGIVGANSEAVRIQWYGGDAPAIVLDGRTRGLRLENFTLENLGRPGLGVGIRFGGDVIGTNHSRGAIERVRVSGFNEGIAIGDTARHAASEMTFRQLLVDHCESGIVVRDNQSVNLEFSQLGLSYNTVGFLGLGGSGVHVIGGSVGHEAEDFAIRAELKRWTIDPSAVTRLTSIGNSGGANGVSRNWPDQFSVFLVPKGEGR